MDGQYDLTDKMSTASVRSDINSACQAYVLALELGHGEAVTLLTGEQIGHSIYYAACAHLASCNMYVYIYIHIFIYMYIYIYIYM